jgi:hypothetical protein
LLLLYLSISYFCSNHLIAFATWKNILIPVVPRSAGTTMKHVTTTCLGKVIATEVGGKEGHHLDQRLNVIKKPHGLFINVDTTTKAGIKHAKSLELVQSKMASVIFTPYVQESTALFDKKHRGRFFTLMRDPVERIVSLYYNQSAEKVKASSLSDFVQTAEDNWMVRTLTGYMAGPLDKVHLDASKEILRSKFLIGLIEKKTESFRRFEEYFGWKFPNPVSQTCKNNMYYFDFQKINKYDQPDKKDPALGKIRTLNMWDIALYEYTKQLFEEQKALFWKKSDLTPPRWKTKDAEEVKVEEVKK